MGAASERAVETGSAAIRKLDVHTISIRDAYSTTAALTPIYSLQRVRSSCYTSCQHDGVALLEKTPYITGRRCTLEAASFSLRP